MVQSWIGKTYRISQEMEVFLLFVMLKGDYIYLLGCLANFQYAHFPTVWKLFLQDK